MILAVDVGSNCSTHGDITCSGRNWDEQSLWHEGMEKAINARAGIGGDEHGVRTRIGLVNRECRDVHRFYDGATGVLCSVAVATAEAASDEAAFEIGW